MSALTPKDIVSQIHEIGSLPQSLAEIMKAINNPNADADSIADVISKDVSLAGRVLKMVNSAHYSRRGKVTKITEAVKVMGINSIRMLALSSSVFGMIPDSELTKKFDIKRIWRHLIETGTAARCIAESIDYKEPEEAYIAGILHDIGMIIMLLYFKDDYIEMINMAKLANRQLAEAETMTFGFNHCDIGYEMISGWRLPSNLSYITASHHDAEQESLIPEEIDLNNIIALADRLTLGAYDDYYPNIEENIKFIRNICEKLNLDHQEIDHIRKVALIQAIQTAEYLDLDISNILEMLTEAKEQLAEMFYSVETMFSIREKLYGNIPDKIMEKIKQPV